MSNPYVQSRQDGNKGFPKGARKYVPRNLDQVSQDFPKSNPTLSNSLRHSLSRQSDASSASTSAAESSTRLQLASSGEWVSTTAYAGNFVYYLPQDEAVATGLGADEGGIDAMESQRVVDLLNRELSRLLKLSPKEFWREVAMDTSLHAFLDSFLKFRSRWYDFSHNGAKKTVAGVIVGDLELSRHVFMVLYRISSNRDPGARAVNSLSLKDHGVILQETKLLDLPKLLDICAIYGHENEDLTKVLVENAIKAQPKINENLTLVISHFLTIVDTMYQRCSIFLEAIYSTGINVDSGLHADLKEVIDFLNDAVLSLDGFVIAYKPAAVFFAYPVETSQGSEEFLCTLARLHDSLLPYLKQGFQNVFSSKEEEMISPMARSLKLLSMRIVKFGWKLLEFCYLGDEVFRNGAPTPSTKKMFPANIEDPAIRGDILALTLREINEVSQLVRESQNSESFLQNVEMNFFLTDRIDNLRKNGWMLIDDEQFTYLTAMFIRSPKAIIKEQSLGTIPATNKMEMDENAVIMESKISQIKDLFPDYGNGFLAACLEAYNQNQEEVIQRILEGTLHADLQLLDTSLETMPVPKTAANVGRNDKGKGKLVEDSTGLTNSIQVHNKQRMEGPSASSSSSGRFVRKSKSELADSDILDNRLENDSARNAALISQYEYEDEYDDSFDDLGLSVAETGMENEIMVDKLRSNLELRSNLVGPSESTSESTAQNASSSKWGSRKKPQFYVKDGKNYSYKVADSIAVANSDEASLITQAQGELIYGLGRGGNLPLGAVKKLMESYKPDDSQSNVTEVEDRVNMGKSRGRGRKEGLQRDSVEGKDKQPENPPVEGRGNAMSHRGGGRRGGRNSYRRDRPMNKHFSSVSGR